MKPDIVESIIGSMLALLGDTFYAGNQLWNLFAVVLAKNPVPPGQKKLLRGASKSLPRYGVWFFHILWSEFPYTGINFGTLQRGSVEEALCQRSIMILQKLIFSQKTFLNRPPPRTPPRKYLFCCCVTDEEQSQLAGGEYAIEKLRVCGVRFRDWFNRCWN